MHRLIGAAAPASSGDGAPDAPASLRDAHETATNAAGWIQANWSDWLAAGLRMLVIAVRRPGVLGQGPNRVVL